MFRVSSLIASPLLIALIASFFSLPHHLMVRVTSLIASQFLIVSIASLSFILLELLDCFSIASSACFC